MFGKRAFDERNNCSLAAQKRCRAEADGQDETSTAIFPPKTAIELAMEEAEEYERRKEAEQRRLPSAAAIWSSTSFHEHRIAATQAGVSRSGGNQVG